MSRLVTHTDLDGIVSGALIYAMHPFSDIEMTDYKWIDHKQANHRFRFLEDDTVVDLPMPDIDVRFWADHHPTGFRHSTPTYDYLYDQHAPSCARLIYDNFVRQHDHLKKYEGLVIDTDMVDSARYKTIDDVHDLSRYGVMLNLAIYVGPMDFNNRFMKPDLIRRIATEPWKQVLDNPLLHMMAEYNVEQHRVYEEDVKRYLRMEGNTVVQDTGGRRVKGSLSRFASFMHFPDSLYQLIIQKKYERYKLIFSENPFIYSHPRNVHLGEFAARLTPGGGGHKAIGQTKEIEPKEFPKKLRFVLDTLNSITSD